VLVKGKPSLFLVDNTAATSFPKNVTELLAVLLRKKVNLAIVLSVLRLTHSDYPVVIFLSLTCFSFRLLPHHALTQEDIIYSVTFLGKEVAAVLSTRNRDGLPFTST
jgi:hypothetical protein